MIPDFRLRLKVNHKSNRVVLAADIHSVFDIAWYTLAKKVCEDAQPQIKQDLEKLDILENPVLRLCPICGQAFCVKIKEAEENIAEVPSVINAVWRKTFRITAKRKNRRTTDKGRGDKIKIIGTE